MSLPALNRWLLAQSVVWGWLLFVFGYRIASGAFGRGDLWTTAACASVSFVWLWRVLGVRGRAADIATAARFVGLIAWLGAVAWHEAIGWGLWCAATLVVVADLVDGWLARRYGGSPAGAHLDMETDQLTTLALALLAAAYAGAGLWTLLLPGYKYGYVVVLRAVGLPAHDPKPRAGDNRRGRRICALVMTLLLAALLPEAPTPVVRASTLLAVLALGFSFASDALFLLRSRRRGSAAC